MSQTFGFQIFNGFENMMETCGCHRFDNLWLPFLLEAQQPCHSSDAAAQAEQQKICRWI